MVQCHFGVGLVCTQGHNAVSSLWGRNAPGGASPWTLGNGLLSSHSGWFPCRQSWLVQNSVPDPNEESAIQQHPNETCRQRVQGTRGEYRRRSQHPEIWTHKCSLESNSPPLLCPSASALWTPHFAAGWSSAQPEHTACLPPFRPERTTATPTAPMRPPSQPSAALLAPLGCSVHGGLPFTVSYSSRLRRLGPRR
jgi:hypothetical protein